MKQWIKSKDILNLISDMENVARIRKDHGLMEGSEEYVNFYNGMLSTLNTLKNYLKFI